MKDWVYLSMDAFREAINRKEFDGMDTSIVLAMLLAARDEALRLGRPIIIDGINLTAAMRSGHIAAAKEYNYTTVAVLFQLSFQESLKNNYNRDRNVPENRMREMNQDLEEPKNSEFDAIFRITKLIRSNYFTYFAQIQNLIWELEKPIIISIGIPGSGKTTFYKMLMNKT